LDNLHVTLEKLYSLLHEVEYLEKQVEVKKINSNNFYGGIMKIKLFSLLIIAAANAGAQTPISWSLNYIKDATVEIDNPQHVYVLNVKNNTDKDLFMVLSSGLQAVDKNIFYNSLAKYIPQQYSGATRWITDVALVPFVVFAFGAGVKAVGLGLKTIALPGINAASGYSYDATVSACADTADRMKIAVESCALLGVIGLGVFAVGAALAEVQDQLNGLRWDGKDEFRYRIPHFDLYAGQEKSILLISKDAHLLEKQNQMGFDVNPWNGAVFGFVQDRHSEISWIDTVDFINHATPENVLSAELPTRIVANNSNGSFEAQLVQAFIERLQKDLALVQKMPIALWSKSGAKFEGICIPEDAQKIYDANKKIADSLYLVGGLRRLPEYVQKVDALVVDFAHSVGLYSSEDIIALNKLYDECKLGNMPAAAQEKCIQGLKNLECIKALYSLCDICINDHVFVNGVWECKRIVSDEYITLLENLDL
jgi:hypothetical protein